MTFVLIMGAMSTGILLLGRLTEAMRESLFWYYGMSVDQLRPVHSVGYVSLTVGQLAVASLALVGFMAFVTAERLRLRSTRQRRAACARSAVREHVARLPRAEWVRTCASRTVGFSLAMVALFSAQVFFERMLGGYGMGWEYLTWASLPPLATLLALCCIVGAFVAAISMYGLHLIYVLERMLARLRPRGASRLRLACRGATRARHTLRELFGDDLLSRPPPRARVCVGVTLPVDRDGTTN